jgi:hypothetical protein
MLSIIMLSFMMVRVVRAFAIMVVVVASLGTETNVIHIQW